jgi:predicted amidohydrolase
VRCGLIQARREWSPEKISLAQIEEKAIAKHERLIAAAAKRKMQILGLQELFLRPILLRNSRLACTGPRDAVREGRSN